MSMCVPDYLIGCPETISGMHFISDTDPFGEPCTPWCAGCGMELADKPNLKSQEQHNDRGEGGVHTMTLVLRVELWPMGDESMKRTIGSMVVTNDETGNRVEDNYNTRLLNEKGKVVRRGSILKHNRIALSVWTLVTKALASVGHDLRNSPLDSCQVCFGTRGCVPGTENVIGGLVLCDECSADRLMDIDISLCGGNHKAPERPKNGSGDAHVVT